MRRGGSKSLVAALSARSTRWVCGDHVNHGDIRTKGILATRRGAGICLKISAAVIAGTEVRFTTDIPPQELKLSSWGGRATPNRPDVTSGCSVARPSPPQRALRCQRHEPDPLDPSDRRA